MIMGTCKRCRTYCKMLGTATPDSYVCSNCSAPHTPKKPTLAWYVVEGCIALAALLLIMTAVIALGYVVVGGFDV